MFEALIGVLKFLKSSLDWVTRLSEDKREKFAAQCEAISLTMKTFLDASKDERKSIELCAQLLVNVKPIRDIAAKTLSEEELEALAYQLEQVCNAWRSHTQSSGESAEHDAANLNQVAEAAGHFSGLAILVRAIS